MNTAVATSMYLAALESLSYSGDERTKIEDIDLTPKTPPIPKGCREYYFNGFTTIASSPKKAMEKYVKWNKDNESKRKIGFKTA